MMGIGMEILFLGLPGTAWLESEAAIQLLRLQPYHFLVTDCRLSIRTQGQPSGNTSYEVCVEIANRTDVFRRIGHCILDSAEAAIRCAFNKAVRFLETVATREDG
ncbi:hypothetical protein E1N52_40610 [Paraburkholderia guartelaensis]|uniref:Uncharacterized protein n=1 Tax=Paraburkholderia guartelaensis TaxID=2546446 RepID=A0A4V2ZUR7_9BURK|nr:hypothetical protein [Paraburkholderia guartelaensis]TDG02258.1 hypothetical protein E1N52_40610 [Paraburkholderia guartelaensis]